MKRIAPSSLVGILFFSLFFPAPGFSAETIPIAAIFSLTGRGENSNVRHLHGAQLAVEELNAAGGLLGKKIELIPLDNETTAVGSVKAVREAIKKKVVAIIGPSWSAHALAIGPLAQEAKIPMISNFATDPQVTEAGDYIFRVCYIDPFQAKAMARFVKERLKLKRVAILSESGNDYSEGLAASFRMEFERMGGDISIKQSYLKESLDYSEIIRSIQKSGAEAVYIPGYDKEPGLIIKQSYKMGTHLPFLGGDGWGDRIIAFVGGPIKEAYEIQAWHPNDPNPLNLRFIQRYEKRFGKDEKILSGTPLAYDAVMLLANAIQRAQSTRPEAIKRALATTQDFIGVTGPIRFDKKRNAIKNVTINRYANSTKSSYYMTIEP